MTPAETGIQANFWTPEYAYPRNISQRNHFAPVSGEGVPESIFEVVRRQKDLKVNLGEREQNCAGILLFLFVQQAPFWLLLVARRLNSFHVDKKIENVRHLLVVQRIL